MPETSIHVLIIGGGIGGLALAQGLTRAGVSAAVYERDRDRTARPQGYRLHVNPAGSRALYECLPPEVFGVFAATCGHAARAMTFYTEGLKELLTVDVDNGDEQPDRIDRHRSVSRDTLRHVLLAGLDDVVLFDKVCTDYRHEPDGTVTAQFADGTTAGGDVLVAADGGNSVVRRRYLPHADRIDTGMHTIAGKLPLTDAVRALLPDRLVDGPAAITAPGGVGMFLAAQQFQPSRFPSDSIGGMRLDPVEDFVSWGLGAKRAKLDPSCDLDAMDGTALRALALDLTSRWHPHLRDLIRRTDPATVTCTAIRSSVPIDPWPTTAVTLLGDAIHSMTPARGVGANTALRDAALLTRCLSAAHRGERPLLDAIHDYETQMTDYGFHAVRASLQALKQQTSLESRPTLAAARTALRLLNAVPPLKRRAFADLGE